MVAGGVQTRARAILEDPRYQRTFPSHDEVSLDEPGGRRGPTVSSGPGQVAVPVIGAGAALGRILFLVLIVVAILLFVIWAARSVTPWVRRREAVSPEAPSPAGVAATEPEPRFEDAARLAAEGRYAEAVHALLLAAIRHFAERSRVAVQPSRTSRELVRLLPLGADAREAFADLVRMVELSLFGGAPVSAEDYERSLARFRALTRRPA